jgi:DNA-directed RNA polymerase subunit M/transcription elongation factor TFIIS
MSNVDNVALHNSIHINRTAISLDYWRDPIYNKYRIQRVIAIGCCIKSNPLFNKLETIRQDDIIKQIELGCLKSATDYAITQGVSVLWDDNLFICIYGNICTRVQRNLLYNENDEDKSFLISAIIDGTFDPIVIGRMKSHELRPSKNKQIIDSIELMKNQKIKKKYSSQHECFKCHGRKTTEIERQLRSLDEGSTIFITCEMDNCNNVWKINS